MSSRWARRGASATGASGPVRRVLAVCIAAGGLLAGCAPPTGATPAPDRPPATVQASPAVELPAPTAPVARITSADPPGSPVPFRWSLSRGSAPGGHRLLLRGGTLHSIPAEVRLLDAAGRVVATSPAIPATGGGEIVLLADCT